MIQPQLFQYATTIGVNNGEQTLTADGFSHQNLILNNLLVAGYIFIVSGLFFTELKALNRINRLKKNIPSTKIGKIKMYETETSSAPFTFFNSIFWRREIDINSVDGQRILQHELAHIKAGHSYDKLFIRLICNILWINPVFWLLKRELSMVHEYTADKASIAGSDTASLSALILCSLYPNHYLEFTNHFFQSPFKRRLIMLSQNTKIKFSELRQFMVIPVVLLTLCLFAFKIEAKPVPTPDYLPEPIPVPQPVTDTVKATKSKTITYKKGEVVPYAVAPVKPLFQNGDALEFPKWVQSQIKYPEEAAKKKITGTVYIQFTIDIDGSMRDIKLLRRTDPMLEKEALRALSLSPNWTPGKDEKGNIIPVSYQFPVVYKLADGIKIQTKQAQDNKMVNKQMSAPSDSASSDVIPYAVVPVKPLFQNGDAHKFPVWVQKQIKYPEEAAKKKITGTVYVQFTIDTDGSLQNIILLRKIDPLLGEEAIRAIKLSPNWTPGKDEKGNTVKVSYQLPIAYRLKKD
jgi:TonB family protein